jgi:hypothetical protein
MREEKRTEPFRSRVFRHAKENWIEGGVEEPGKGTDHNQDFKADHEIEDDGAAQNGFSPTHVQTSRSESV